MSSGGCDGYTAYSGSDRIDRPCTMPPTEIIVAGCAHEHVGERDLCTMHADEALSGVMLCGDCLNSRKAPHRCRLRAIRRSREPGLTWAS